MIFNRSFTLKSKSDSSTIRKKLVGQHLQVHKIDFEVFDKDNVVRIIPHAEDHDEVLTLPITRLDFDESPQGSRISIKSHPRKIDVGGPYLLVIICILAILGGTALLNSPTYRMIGSFFLIGAILTLAIFWIKMELGYFDYVRKIKNWVKSQIA